MKEKIKKGMKTAGRLAKQFAINMICITIIAAVVNRL